MHRKLLSGQTAAAASTPIQWGGGRGVFTVSGAGTATLQYSVNTSTGPWQAAPLAAGTTATVVSSTGAAGLLFNLPVCLLRVNLSTTSTGCNVWVSQ